VAAQGGDRCDVGGLLDGGGEDGVGADLDEPGVAVVDELADGGVEGDGVAEVVIPVLGVVRGGDIGQVGEEPVGGGVDVGGEGGVVDRDGLGVDTAVLVAGDGLGYRAGVA